MAYCTWVSNISIWISNSHLDYNIPKMGLLLSLCKVSLPHSQYVESHPPWFSNRGHSWPTFPHSSSPFSLSANPIGFTCSISFEFIHFSPCLILSPLPPLSLSLINVPACQYLCSSYLLRIPYELIIAHQPEHFLEIQIRLCDFLAKNSSVVWICGT